MNRHLRCLLATAALLLAGSASAQQYVYVQSGALGGTGSCTLPFGDLVSAIDFARPLGIPVEIRVAQGTYNTAGDRGLLIDFSEVHIKGGYPRGFTGCGTSDAAIESNRVTANPGLTIVDGLLADRHAAILPLRDYGPDGVPGGGDDTFLATNTDILIDNILFRNGKPTTSGAGGSMLILNCNVTITNNRFETNTTNDHFFGGGALYFVGYATTGPTFNDAQLELHDNVFDRNQTGQGFSGSGAGGAFFASDLNVDAGPPPVIQRRTVVNASNNIFQGNISNGSGTLAIDPYCLDGAGAPAPNSNCDGDMANEACLSRSIGGAAYLSNIRGVWNNNQ